MPTYKYTAINSDGKTIRGRITASNELDLEDRLSALGLDIMNHKLLAAPKASIFSKVNIKELIMLCVHLEQLDKAGVPLLDALADMRDSADSPVFRSVMAEIYESVKTGDLLSTAFAKRSDIFNEVFVGLIQAGERTGNLAATYSHLAHHLKWNSDLKRSVKKASMYPITLLVVMSGVVTMMMLFVVPKLVDFMTSQGFDLPLHTRALIATSAIFSDYWYLILGLPIIAFFMLIIMYKTSAIVHYTIDGIMLKMPFLGTVILKINLARFSHFFAITFSSGIGVLECLETARKVVGNDIIRDSISAIMRNVAEGNSLTRSISSTQKFPSLVVRMFKVGEDSGNMEEALQNINFFYDREVKDSVDALIKIIQPILTIVIGAIMFWIIAAVFGPLYDSFSKTNF